LDHTLDDNVRAYSSNTDDSHQIPTADIGALNSLPPELHHKILGHLDIRSLKNFKLVNRQTSSIVDSCLLYQELKESAPNVICGILSTKSEHCTPINILYQKLCTPTCDRCWGENGAYFHLLTQQRLCHRCLFRYFSYIPLTKADAILKFGLEPKVVDSLPCIRSHPGKYGN
ncbi:uncharacterized protein EI97DRAFT_342751, partial [Westerdykella ornata]